MGFLRNEMLELFDQQIHSLTRIRKFFSNIPSMRNELWNAVLFRDLADGDGEPIINIDFHQNVLSFHNFAHQTVIRVFM